jgi:hypothetical protein
MSTPISRHSKLQGLALYAPRHARERADTDEPPSDAASAEPPESDRADVDTDSYRSADAGSADAANAADIHEWLDQAIREAVDLGRAAESAEAAVPELELAQAPGTAPAQSEAEDWPPPRPEPRGQRYRTPAPAPPRRPRLEAEIVPEPPADPRGGDFFRLFVRLSVVIVFAALVAYGLTTMPWSPPRWMSFKTSDDRVAAAAPSPQPEQAPQQAQTAPPPPSPPARLIVQDQQAWTNEPVSLPIVVEHGNQHQSLVVDGLVQGTTLSEGAPANASSWRLPSDKLRGLYLYAPKDFVGVMNTTVDLLGSDQRLLDSRAMQLKWIAAQPKPAPVPALATATADAAPGQPRIGAGVVAPVIAPIDPAEAAMLMQRGRDFLSAGDLSAARVAFRRLADAGMADATLALANTYDPDYLATHNVVGVAGDRATALALYRRAKQLGSAEAARILAQIAGN